MIGGSEGGRLWAACMLLVVVKMLIYLPCANDVVRGVEVRTSLVGPVLALSSL